MERTSNNHAPVPVGTLPRLGAHIGNTMHYQLPPGLFTDANHDPLSYAITLARQNGFVNSGGPTPATP